MNGKLQQRQDHMEELNQVRSLLLKLQGVFELPKKLRAAIDRQAYDIAVDSYAEVVPLLQKYGHKVAPLGDGDGVGTGGGDDCQLWQVVNNLWRQLHTNQPTQNVCYGLC